MTETSAVRRSRPPAVRTFLIADVRGYTSFTVRQGDEAASRLTAKFAEVAREGVEAWGGTLVETRGDEVLAAFDSARRALRCAVELQAALAAETRLNPSLPLSVGIGLDAGEAVAVGDGYRGAALNLAARLCAAAGGGEIIASANLVHLAGTIPDIELVELGPTVVKGLKDPIATVRVEGAATSTQPDRSELPSASAAQPPLPAEIDPIVPLAGREEELRWLAWHWRRAGHGAGRAIVISGPPGIGKTRLAAELAGRVHADGAGVAYLPAARGADEPLAIGQHDGPQSLVIVDDLDAAPARLAKAVVRLAEQAARHRVLVLVSHREEAAPSLTSLIEQLAPPELRLPLGPLEADAIHAIAALYAGKASAQLPLTEAMAETGGLPAAVHRWASAWARRTVTARLGASAGRTSEGRRGLRAAEAELMGEVAAYELARERTELYGADRPIDQAGASRPALEVCPYKGLAAFEASDAEFYFGRERLVAELVARLVGTSFLGLVGASGSGKSSAIRAGLMPAISGGVLPGSELWPQVLLRPGEQPLTELRRALARVVPPRQRKPVDAEGALDRALAGLPPGGRLLVVVDQFEEVFNATRDETERAAFIDLLTAEHEGLKVSVTLRADHYGHCASYPALAKLLGSNQVLVGPLIAAELEAVIEHPAQRVGLRVESGLTDALLTDLGDEPGALPLLSTALLELWQSRQHGRLTLSAYRATGGVHGAVARLAEAAYAELEPEQQQLARSILLRLAGPGEGEGVVRRRAPLAEFDVERDPGVAAVIEALTRARLLIAGEGYVEVAHEALLREWPRLEEWIAEDATGRQLRLHVTAAAREWDEGGREPGDLYRGARLAAAVDWAPAHEVELNILERDFLEESRLASERETERQRRVNRRLRALLAGAAVFLVVALGAGAFAAYQAQVARQAEDFARSRELAASAIAVLGDDPTLSKLLALEAASIANPPVESLAALHRAWDADRVIYRYEWPSDKPVSNLFTEIDPSGRYIVASGFIFAAPHDRVEVFDRQENRVLWSFESADESIAVGEGLFTPDGGRVVFGAFRAQQVPPAGAGSASDDAGIHVREVATGNELHHLTVGPCGGVVVGASNISALVMSSSAPECIDFLAASTRRNLELWLIDFESGGATMLSSHAWSNDEGAISADGRTVAYTAVSGSTEPEPQALVVDTQSGEQTLIELEDGTAVHDIDPLGELVLLEHDGRLKVWDVAAAEVVLESPAVVSGLHYAQFSRDVSAVVWTSDDGLLTQWPLSGADVRTFPAPQGGYPSATSDGLVLVPSLGTTSALLVDTTLHPEIAAVPLYEGWCSAWFYNALDVAGSRVAIDSDCDGVAATRVMDRASLTVTHDLPDGLGMALSPDGSRLARQTAHRTEPDEQDEFGHVEVGSVEIVDLESRETVKLEGLCAYNLDREGNLHLPAENPGCAEFPTEPFELRAWRLRWSPDGSMVAAVDGTEGYWAVWDTSDGSLISDTLRVARRQAFDVRFTADSRNLIVSYTGSATDYGSTDFDSIESISTASWVVEQRRPLTTKGLRLELAGLSDDGSTMFAVSGVTGTGEQAIYWVAADSLEERQPKRPRLHGGTLTSVAVNEQTTLMATGSSDGTVRVWDAGDGRLVHELTFPASVSGVAFLTNDHLGVLLADGNLRVVTIDADELLAIVRQSLTRSFTDAECERFNFDPCPALGDMRSGH